MSKTWTRIAKMLVLPALLVAVVGLDLALRGTERFPREEPRWHVPGGDAKRGRVAIRRYGCGGCHTIPGIPDATGKVGPHLASVRETMFVGGVLANTPQNLVFWIQHPQEADPRTAMPDLGVTEAAARDIAAYLYGEEN